ncbi:MAG: ABC transporter ATP-binding protein [Methanobacteriota archaeon]|nr:MAG: ABC transporter ATP-binding protein [Euryarchaeota archaeon]
MSDPTAVIETVNITKRFKEVLAVDSLSMKVQKGEIFGFLGPNGAGKSTTIKMVMGLFHPTSGSAFINGKPAGPDSVELRRDIGFLPERISFYDNLTPIQTLNFYCELRGADKSVVPSLIKEVGLEHAANRKVGTFSKGMVQLLGVAQAMIGNPSIYIMDEPTGGLDARWVKTVRDKIRTLNEQGATIIFSSHILSEVQALCHRIAIIDKGRLVVEGTVEDISDRLRIMPRLWIQASGIDKETITAIRSIAGVEEVSMSDEGLLVTCETEARMTVIASLRERGVAVSDFKTIDPSLEEAFVRLLSDKEGS